MKKKKGRSQMAEEACPCFSNDWNNHEDYLDCITETIAGFAKKTQVKILKKAERSDCGKSAEEVCPCSSRWNNHKQYVSCITKAVRGLTLEKQDDIISDAEVSDCGKNIEETCPCNSDWDDHDEYMLCITDAAQGLDDKKQTKVLNKAERSHCGDRNRSTEKSKASIIKCLTFFIFSHAIPKTLYCVYLFCSMLPVRLMLPQKPSILPNMTHWY